MKKVYGSFRQILLSVVLFLLPGCLGLLGINLGRSIVSPWFACSLLQFFRTIYDLLISDWSYDESGFVKNNFRKTYCKWGEVIDIKYSWKSLSYVAQAGEVEIKISPLATHNYSKVISDVLKFVRSQNPHVLIDSRLLKKYI